MRTRLIAIVMALAAAMALMTDEERRFIQVYPG
jgi:hypothetical protein